MKLTPRDCPALPSDTGEVTTMEATTLPLCVLNASGDKPAGSETIMQSALRRKLCDVHICSLSHLLQVRGVAYGIPIGFAMGAAAGRATATAPRPVYPMNRPYYHT